VPRILDAVSSATDAELELARQTVRATFHFLPFMVRVIGVLTGDDNHIGLAVLRDADQKPELLFVLIPMIVALLRAGWRTACRRSPPPSMACPDLPSRHRASSSYLSPRYARISPANHQRRKTEPGGSSTVPSAAS
jgi:hypothetical protein